ncbi:MAG: ubiquinone/menaquinone biosynthesis methyltransferase [Desulfobacterales bacterium]|nr:ubiquinone/menaquinone biosynthesis methyltransferase [Desulfobacterales bacterium]
MMLPERHEKARVVRSMFARIAARYDLMNRLMTFGQDRVWQREVVGRAALGPGGRLLDIGCGTGGIAKTAGRDPSLRITAADFTPEMLRRGRSTPPARRLEWCCADALALPFADRTFDAVTSGYLLRNVVAIDRALAEQVRVAKPGARIVCLDTAPPEGHILQPLVNLHMQRVIPWLGGLVSGDRYAYHYLPQSTESFKTPAELARLMRAAGLVDVVYQQRMFNTVTIIYGTVPEADSRSADRVGKP